MPESPLNTCPADHADLHAGYQICYSALRDGHRSLCFRCDASGRVDLNALSPRELSDYLYARAMVGRVFALPVLAPH